LINFGRLAMTTSWSRILAGYTAETSLVTKNSKVRSKTGASALGLHLHAEAVARARETAPRDKGPQRNYLCRATPRGNLTAAG
jgi:hypothetical protein